MMKPIALLSLLLLSACPGAADEPPPDVCQASAEEFCDTAIECGQIREVSRADCEAFAMAYCVAPGEWSECEAALDAMACPVDNRPIEAACWDADQ